MPLNQLTSVMKCILEEGVPISDLRIILESLGSMNIQKMDIDDIAERIRPKLVPLLIQKLVKFKETVPLITFAPDLEQMILTTVRQNPEEKMLLLEGSLAKKILSLPNPAPSSTRLFIFFSLKISKAFIADTLGSRPNISGLFEKLISQCPDCWSNFF